MCKLIEQKRLFNPDAKGVETMFGGETSGLLNLSHIPKEYEIFHKLVDTAYSNNWLPQKVNMAGDVSDYKNKLTEDEREAFDTLISFLAFLDSLQTNNLPNIFRYITNPHVVYFGARQAWDEAVHSKSYGWVLSSIMSKEDAARLYNKWKENKLLLERNKFIADIYQEFVDTPSELTFFKTVVANYILEGLYFYNAFQFFHNLASRGKMTATDTQISYIQRDELIHCSGFENIINILFKENPDFSKYRSVIEDMFKTAAEWEVKFGLETIGNKVLGMSEQSLTDNIYYLGNKRLKAVGCNQIFPKVQNPFAHLDKQSGAEDESSNRTNNFEGTSIAYKSPEVFKEEDWDDL